MTAWRTRVPIWLILLGLLVGPAGVLVHNHAASDGGHDCAACLLLASALAALPALLVLPVLADPVARLTLAVSPILCTRVPCPFSQRAPPV